MTTVADLADKVRSKNAGPFWLTVDIFCPDAENWAALCRRLPTARVADAFGCAPDTLRRFDIADLNVIKFSLPRPQIQGSKMDRDMHGAGWGPLVAGLALDERDRPDPS